MNEVESKSRLFRLGVQTDELNMFTEERQKEIVDNFNALLFDAVQDPRKATRARLRDKGASLLELTMHLSAALIDAKKTINILVIEKEQNSESFEL
jgi:hypothetical protein